MNSFVSALERAEQEINRLKAREQELLEELYQCKLAEQRAKDPNFVVRTGIETLGQIIK